MSPSERDAIWNLRGLATAHLPALAFQAACELDLFSILESSSGRPEEMARACGVEVEAMKYLLEAMAGLGLLHRHEDHYRNSQAASQLLVRDQPLSQLDVIRQNRLCLAGLEQWQSALGLGEELTRRTSDPEERLAALHAQALPSAGPLADRLKLGPSEKVLDLGGGAGTYLLELKRRQPALEAFLMERPELCPALRRRVEPAIQVVEGDFRTSPLGAGYTLILLSHMANYLQAQEFKSLLGRCCRALAPAGRLVLHDIFLGGLNEALAQEALFALRLMGEGQGQGHRLDTVVEALVEAGCEDPDMHDLSPEPAHLLIGRKGREAPGPSRPAVNASSAGAAPSSGGRRESARYSRQSSARLRSSHSGPGS